MALGICANRSCAGSGAIQQWKSTEHLDLGGGLQVLGAFVPQLGT